jgi:hypothetical protein
MRNKLMHLHALACEAEETTYRATPDTGADLTEMVDTLYAYKKTREAFENACRVLNGRIDALTKMSVLQAVRVGHAGPIQTDWCTATLDVETTVDLPKRGSDDYSRLCEDYGVDPASPFRPNWKDLSVLATAKAKFDPPSVDASNLHFCEEVSTQQQFIVEDTWPSSESVEATRSTTANVRQDLWLANAPKKPVFSVVTRARKNLPRSTSGTKQKDESDVN